MGCTSYGQGYAGSERWAVLWREGGGPGDPAVLSLQGSHSLAIGLIGDANAEDISYAGFVRIAGEGFVVAQGDLGQTVSQGTFGNDTVISRVGSLKAAVQAASSPVQARAGKVALLGASGGGTAALNYAIANPGNVACIFLTTPLVALRRARDENWGGYAAEIETAYGGAAGFNAAVATRDPSEPGRQAALAGIPILISYSVNDSVIPYGSIFDYAELLEDAGVDVEVAPHGAVDHSATGMRTSQAIELFKRGLGVS